MQENSIESTIRALLKNALAGTGVLIERIGLDDDLYDLGINSVSMVKLIVLVEDEFGFEFDDDDLIGENLNTIHKLVSKIKNRNQ